MFARASALQHADSALSPSAGPRPLEQQRTREEMTRYRCILVSRTKGSAAYWFVQDQVFGREPVDIAAVGVRHRGRRNHQRHRAAKLRVHAGGEKRNAATAHSDPIEARRRPRRGSVTIRLPRGTTQFASATRASPWSYLNSPIVQICWPFSIVNENCVPKTCGCPMH